ncbi:hypothetical protein Tco_1523103 [Tanacetum coccineum]
MEQLNKKSNENADVLAQIQKKGFAIAALKNELRKLTGNSVNTKFAKPSILGKNRWVPTGKTFASSTTKVESEPPNGSNADIPNQCESEQALNVSAADQASVFMEMMYVHISSGLVLHQMTSDHNRSELGIHDHSNEPSSSKLILKVVPLAVMTATSRQGHKVVRLGINPMIQPEPEDLPKDNPKLEIAVLRWQYAPASEY